MAARTCAFLSALTMVTLLCPQVAHASTDTDNDGVPDDVEIALGTNPAKFDTDGDGISDGIELSTALGAEDWKRVDSDGDGVPDALDADSDDDGVPDAFEGIADMDGDGIRAFRDWDDDNDGINTSAELADAAWSDVSDDVDGDGLKNWEDTDADGDGKPDMLEGRSDNDGDGLSDYLQAFQRPAGSTAPIGMSPVAKKPGDLGPSSAIDPPASSAHGGLGGGCNAAGTGAPGSAAWLLGLAAFVVGRRRRTRVSPASGT